MFELEKKIENITGGFSFSENSLISCVKGFLVEYSLNTFEQIKRSNEKHDFQEILFFENLLIGLSNNVIKYFDADFNLIESIPFELGIGDFHVNRTGKVIVNIDYDYSLFLPLNGVFDLAEKKILWEGIKGDNLKLVNDQIFGVSKNRVSNLNIIDGSVNWTIEFEEEQTVPHIYYGNESYVLIGFEEKNIFSLIEGKSGEVVWTVDSFNKGIRVDSERNLVHQFLIGYIKISLDTGEVLDKNVNREYFSEIGIESQRANYVLNEDYIYTTDWRKGVIGAFSLNKLKFDWVYKIDNGNFSANKRLLWKNPYLLVEDSKNSLYIFKKQDQLA